MSKYSEILKVAAVAGVCAGLMACATKAKHSYSLETNPEAEEKAVSAQWEQLNQEQMDVFAPVYFQKAEKALKEAREDIADRENRDEILNELQKAKSELDRAKAHGDLWKAELAPVAAAREKTVAAGVHASFSKELSKIDKDLKDITEENFESGENAKEIARLQKRYMDLELKTIQKNSLHDAREMIKTARDEGAKRYAPDTLAKAELAVLTADRQIEANRNNPDLYQDSVAVANTSARELLAITLGSKEARGKTPEELALAIRNQQKQLEAKNLQTTQALEQVDALTARNVEQGAQIASQTQELKAVSASIASEKEMSEKLRDIESKFSNNEAEVYRQGENVVVRLKSMQFPSSKADLPASSLPVLAKVKSVVDELQAEKVVVEGHTDSVGAREINQRISQDRAQAVSKYLTSNGAQARNIETVGYGFDKPLASNKTKAGRAENRRVDIVITPSRIE